MSDPARAPLPLPSGGGGEPPSYQGGSRRAPPQVLSPDEWARLLLALKTGPNGPRNHTMALAAFWTAARGSEVCAMRLDGIDWSRNRIRWWRSKTRTWHELAMHPELRNRLERWVRLERPASDVPWLFPGRSGPLTCNGFWRALKVAGAHAGVPSHKARCHVLRHTRAARLLADGCPMAVVQHILGHRRLAITADTYGHIGDPVVDRWATA